MPPLIGITGRAEQVSTGLSTPFYGAFQSYVVAVREAGGLPLIVPPILNPAHVPLVATRLDGLLLSGGGDIDPAEYGEPGHPLAAGIDLERDRTELLLVRAALENGLPILAICRGIQVLNVALGGTLFVDIPTQVPDAVIHDPKDGDAWETFNHTVHLTPGSRLAAIFDAPALQVNSFHHQATRRVADGLVVTARAADGVVEGLEHRRHPFCVGVQWHPESRFGNQPGMERLFVAFVRAAGG
ncbi:MAG: gamma-glutamyl-gamma-aminobutyrate hydrolase family protein [Anaerolineae bacterium]|nr:gamma-glutamyl-gamma-aminobutyrate hydrolase family protein [Anaerolineae bacterium]